VNCVNAQVRVDHRTAAVSFGSGVGMTQDIVREGPSIQSMPSEQMRFQLINMAVALDKAMNVISPKELKVTTPSILTLMHDVFTGTILIRAESPDTHLT